MTEESDHQAILVRALETAPNASRGGDRPFRYEEAWTRHEQYEQMVIEAWEAAGNGGRDLEAVWNKLVSVSGSMQRWAREVFRSIRRKIAKLKAQLVDAKTRAFSTGYQQEVRDLEEQLREMFEREEILYRQRSRVDWLMAADQNTKYFQNRASHRKRKNTIKALIREDGTRCSVNEDMREMAASFYEQLFTSEGSMVAEALLQNIEHVVTGEMNARLTAPFTDDEIQAALFQMGPTKSPGPDGLPVLFYQRHWPLVREDVCSAVRAFLNGAATPDAFNDTVIVMIDP